MNLRQWEYKREPLIWQAPALGFAGRPRRGSGERGVRPGETARDTVFLDLQTVSKNRPLAVGASPRHPNFSGPARRHCQPSLERNFL